MYLQSIFCILNSHKYIFFLLRNISFHFLKYIFYLLKILVHVHYSFKKLFHHMVYGLQNYWIKLHTGKMGI
uniref:Uncharacterized protein n=1 Tax=Sus scrofa TaxID=9823 RepID=A0A4X1T3Q0_PIG